MVIASAGDGDEGVGVSLGQAYRSDVSVSLIEGKHARGGDGISAGTAEQLGEPAVLVRTRHEVHPRLVDESRSDPLRHTAKYADAREAFRFGAAETGLPSERLEEAKSVPDLVLSVLPDGAGVGKDHISRLEVIAEPVPLGQQDRPDDVAVREVHLAAVGLDEEGLRPGAGRQSEGPPARQTQQKDEHGPEHGMGGRGC